MPILKAHDLVKSYKHRTVVNQANIQIKQGEIVGLLGPNGAGKTTCFYMIVGLITPDRGHITLDDQDITRLPMHKRALRGIGYLPQEPSVFRKLTVAENIMAILELRKGFRRSQRNALLDKLLHEFHINHIRDSLAMRLSGGERRRVEIARALAMEPNFILLDEPFAGIDPISVIDIKNIISHLCERGIGVLITDHNVRETLDICERAYILDQGQVIASGAPDVIMHDKTVKAVYLGDNFKM